MRATLGSLAIASLLVAWALPAVAANVVIPNINANQPGPSNQAFPWNQGQMRYQQVYARDQFQGLTGPVTMFSYRVDESAGGPFTSGPIDCEIRLCHTNAAPNALSLNFADNLGGDVTLVFDGLISLSSAGNPAVFDINVDINNNFFYNGSQNLLIEIKVFGPASTTQFDAAGTGLGEGGTPWTDRLWAFDPNAVSGSSSGDDGYVTQFTLETATAVENSTWGGIKAMYSD
jgi:hypothetical protein